MNPAEWLIRSSVRTPDAPALLQGEELRATYAQFADRAARIGAALVTKGIAPGDRVALFAKNCPEYLEAIYGIWFAGAVAVPINGKLHPREAAWIVEASEAKLAFTGDPGIDLGVETVDLKGPAYADLLRHDPMPAPVEIIETETVWLFYTSGTTGRPKGVCITSANVQAMCLGYFSDVDSVEPQDAILYAAPMSHGAGLYNFVHVMRGARHVVPHSGGFEADEILDLAPKLQHVSMFAAPTMIRRLVDRARATGQTGEGIKTIVYGGGPMYVADIIDAVEVMGPRFVQIYGQGESPMTITALSRELVADRSHPRWRERLASVGQAQSPVAVRIADSEGRALPAGETGEILVRGAAVMGGYWQNPEASAKALRDGWLWTGDLGTMDADGFVTLQDRSKDVIISGGTNIYPREVEEALLLHPSVHEVAVVGKPDPEWGESVVAFVTPAPETEIDPAALDQHCCEQIARFKRPKAYRVVTQLPKNNYGKVLKTELRKKVTEED
ncbi:long-chain acyl-CoA synthetase [Thioclava sp. ES.031]|uniref:class I adenylate-forming enzyme family protein n=1 Tax=Thioclava sp. ES.031 TaxID=1798203 RepID=UPI000BF7F446|nr:AMP-binding protein [Thioclava sp. ES.031]PFG63005.1 long-chain acyl-CoA synthetase [Thioclava sp. ES.031]